MATELDVIGTDSELTEAPSDDHLSPHPLHDADPYRLSRLDKFWNCVCMIGLVLVLFSAILMIPLAFVFFGITSVDFAVHSAESPLRDRGLEALRSQIAGVQIDPITGTAGTLFWYLFYVLYNSDYQVDVATTTVSYELKDFEMVSFVLNEDSTQFDVSVGTISVDSEHNQVNIAFNWSFEEQRFKVGDDGSANAISNDFHMNIKMKLVSLTKLQVVECTFDFYDLGKLK